MNSALRDLFCHLKVLLVWIIILRLNFLVAKNRCHLTAWIWFIFLFVFSIEVSFHIHPIISSFLLIHSFWYLLLFVDWVWEFDFLEFILQVIDLSFGSSLIEFKDQIWTFLEFSKLFFYLLFFIDGFIQQSLTSCKILDYLFIFCLIFDVLLTQRCDFIVESLIFLFEYTDFFH